MAWKIRRISAPTARVELVDESGAKKTLVLRGGRELDLATLLADGDDDEGEAAESSASTKGDSKASATETGVVAAPDMKAGETKDRPRPAKAEAKKTAVIEPPNGVAKAEAKKTAVTEPPSGVVTEPDKARDPKPAGEVEEAPKVDTEKARAAMPSGNVTVTPKVEVEKAESAKPDETKRATPKRDDKKTQEPAVRESKATPKAKHGETPLPWVESTEDKRPILSAAFKGGRFVIVKARRAHVLAYEWKDGTLREFDVGDREYLQAVAQLYVAHGVVGHDSIDAFLDELKRPDPRIRPSKQTITLSWSREEKSDKVYYRAALGAHGRFIIHKQEDGYDVDWKPRGGGRLCLGVKPKLTDAKEVALLHARKVVGLAGDERLIGDVKLTWRETVKEGRKVCVCAMDDGDLELIETKTGSFALFHVRSPEDWDALGCGSKIDMKKKAAKVAADKELSPMPAKPPRKKSAATKSGTSTPTDKGAADKAPDKESAADTSMTDAERDAVITKGLEEALRGLEERILG